MQADIPSDMDAALRSQYYSPRFCELHQEITKLGRPLAVDFVALLARIQLLKPIIEQILENPDSYPFIAQIRDILVGDNGLARSFV